MTVLIRNHVEGMNASRYDEIAPPLIEKLKTQAGFLLHVSYETNAGEFVVAEIWESQEQHAQWFDENVKPNLPGTASHEVMEIHSLHRP
ncbi:MAG TPA: antibiotic biosynthesis monooxygenase [Gaiellaceae bacterium]|nr:antibiotic biosynthesis monooxygenase [Gaiellaceae bacterium]